MVNRRPIAADHLLSLINHFKGTQVIRRPEPHVNRRRSEAVDLREDLQEATDAGKRFAIVWEQDGCPYCKEMHLTNFADPEVRDYVERNFVVLQLNIWGSREVTDFDGEVMSEKALARRNRVRFTPTIQFFPALGGGSGDEDVAEVTRMPG